MILVFVAPLTDARRIMAMMSVLLLYFMRSKNDFLPYKGYGTMLQLFRLCKTWRAHSNNLARLLRRYWARSRVLCGARRLRGTVVERARRDLNPRPSAPQADALIRVSPRTSLGYGPSGPQRKAPIKGTRHAALLLIRSRTSTSIREVRSPVFVLRGLG